MLISTSIGHALLRSRHKSISLSIKQQRQVTHLDIAFNWSRRVTATKREQFVDHGDSGQLGSTSRCDSLRDRTVSISRARWYDGTICCSILLELVVLTFDAVSDTVTINDA